MMLLLILLLRMLGIAAAVVVNLPSETTNDDDGEDRKLSSFWLRTILCRGECVDDCMRFLTPINKCYNGQHLFPGDPSWSSFDMLDIVAADNDHHGDSSFGRFLFDSTDGSCRGMVTDNFILPLHACVGPFGEPRPWGNFSMVAQWGENESSTGR